MQRAEYHQWKSMEVARLLALVEAERRYYQDIFAALPVAVCVVDAGWRLAAVNRAFRRRFGLVREDLGEARLPDLIPDPELETRLRHVLETGQEEMDFAATLGTGETARRLRLTLQRIPGWQLEAQDEVFITLEEERAPGGTGAGQPAAAGEQQALAPPARIEEAKRAAIERLSARVAHVANNLLMIIGGYGEEVMESLPQGDVRRTGMAEILKAAARLGALTRDLTALTRPVDYDVAAFDLARWMKSMEARHAGLRLHCETPATGLAVKTSPVLLEQIVFEAARYMQPHLGAAGRLRLEARPLGAGRVELRLEMEGPEMSEEARERFFEPFSGEKAGADPPVGVAAHVKSWQKLGGAMRLEACALVLTADRAAGAEDALEEAPLLLVEDEPGIRGLIARALEREGFRVVQAGDPGDALALWKEKPGPPRALITDLVVPGISGGELASRLRARWPALPVLYISGYTSETELATAAASAQLGPATRFLAKPFTTAQLVQEVRRLLD